MEAGVPEDSIADSNAKCDGSISDEEAGVLQAAEEVEPQETGFVEESIKPLKELCTASLPPRYYEFSCHVLAFVTSISICGAVVRQHGFNLFAW
jgi:hypothetical protein